MPDFLRRCARSLLLRMAVVIFLAAIALNFITYTLFFSYQHNRSSSYRRNMARYAQFLVRELGSPPSRARADAMGRNLLMRVTLENPEGIKVWSAGGDHGHFPGSHLLPWFSDDAVEAARLHGYQRIQVHADDGSVLTFDIYPTPEERAALQRYGVFFLLLTGAILLAVYGLMHHLLRPVRWLAEGAAAVRDGDLSRRVPEKRGGELRDLSHTFNEMVARLEGLMQAQQRLLLGVSHELRTPLTRLKLRLEMLEAGPRTTGMRDDLHEMESMVTRLLDAARLSHEAGSLNFERTDLVALLAATAHDHRNRRPGVRLHLPSTPVPAWVATAPIRSLISNLLDNALKYSDPNDAPVELHLAVDALRGAECAVVSVRDHGIGIPEEAVAHLFEPFFRVDESRTRESGGFGLGLSLCRAIVQAHGGEIRVASTPGRGTTVTARLPLPQKRPEPDMTAQSSFGCALVNAPE